MDDVYSGCDCSVTSVCIDCGDAAWSSPTNPYDTVRASSAVTSLAASGAVLACFTAVLHRCRNAAAASGKTIARGQYIDIVFFMMAFSLNGVKAAGY